MNRRRLRKDPKPVAEEQILPLINVVFLLLIFFMVVGKLSSSDPFEITSPFSSSDAPAEQRDITVYIAADGRIALGNEIVAVEHLTSAVRMELTDSGNAPLRVKADSSADARLVVRILDALRNAGATEATLMTLSQPGA